MARIKKRGLDYFPLHTDFIHNRIVRRIMKREGDATLSILLCTYTYIYSGEGYYVRVDHAFYEDLADCLYQTTADDACRVLALAVEHGLFDAEMFAREGILTSAEIQREFLFCTKRRKKKEIDPRYCLIEEEEGEKEAKEENATLSAENVTQTPENVTLTPENVASGTQSTAQKSTAQHKETKNPLLKSSPETGGTAGEDADRESAEEIRCRQEEAPDGPPTADNGTGQTDEQQRNEEYRQRIARLQPPADGLLRNLEGLMLNLRQLPITPQEQYAIILKSNFGLIGHPMWRGFGALRESHGKIRQPGKYLLSLCGKKGIGRRSVLNAKAVMVRQEKVPDY